MCIFYNHPTPKNAESQQPKKLFLVLILKSWKYLKMQLEIYIIFTGYSIVLQNFYAVNFTVFSHRRRILKMT